MAVELTAESTHDDIQAYVDQILEDRSGEQSEEKSDAQQISEERDEPAVAEVKTGDEAETTDDGDDAGESGSGQDWLDDDLRAEVAAYGIDEEVLSDFQSREELDRALRLIDRSALEAGRKSAGDTQTESAGKARDEQGRFSKSEPKDDAKASSQPGRYEVSLSKEIYDEGLVDEFTRLRDHYELRLASVESRFAEADAMVRQQQFDSAVDSLGHSDLFGKTGSESQKELERRKTLYMDCEAMIEGLIAQGRPVKSYESLVPRVARMAFAEELGKKELKARTRKIAKQADGRMGGGQTKPTDPTENLREWARREYKSRESAG